MAYQRVLTIQDISCVGQCSMTVALPILSACGVETCVLPSAVLSTHTGGFKNPAFRDLTADIPAICDHWRREKIDFYGIYTGYLGDIRQIDTVLQIFKTLKAPDGVTVVDPAMADHGKLYSGFDEAYVTAMIGLCAEADIVIPNITEACMMTGTPYPTDLDKAWVTGLLQKLSGVVGGTIVLTGVGYGPEASGVAVYSNGELWHYAHPKLPGSYHGTGDIFASCMVGAYARGKGIHEAVRIAADYTTACIRNTFTDPAHWYGVKFETALPELIRLMNES